MTLVTARPSYSLEWSLGAAGRLLGEEERAARSRFGDDEEPSWQDLALCAETDPEAFFPEKGGSVREAKAVCRKCEVRRQCLEYALENDERFGIWGGLSERERRRVNPLAGRPAGIAIAESDERERSRIARRRPDGTWEPRAVREQEAAVQANGIAA